MPENNSNQPDNNFKEAVCIDVGRVYDSCCDRDCVEDLRCYFSPEAQCTVENAISVRLKKAEVLNVCIDVEQVSFNRGYYACDMTFFFLVTLDVFTAPHTCPVCVNGICNFNKKVILFGSEGNVKIFENNACCSPEDGKATICDTPRCVVQTVEPVALSARLGKVGNGCDCLCNVPSCVTDAIGGNLASSLDCNSTAVYVTLGLFTIVQLIRNVQMLIPVYDFCIPEKQCTDVTDQPCDVFRRIKFPTNDFFPPKADPDCGCGHDEK